MHIEHIYIGGWFQRTTLHLSEMYDFLKYGTSSLALDKNKLTELHRALDCIRVELDVSHGLERIDLSTRGDVCVRIFEDGLIVLSFSASDKHTVRTDIERLRLYYEQKLSPAFSYLFSLGAPVPKELANIATVYPYFVITKRAKKDDALALLKEFNQVEHYEVQDHMFDIYRGDKLYIINNRHAKDEVISHFVHEQIFLREFKSQLHRYLHLHRTIWERIADVIERKQITGKEIGEFKNKLDGYSKTVNLIEARIFQMNSYLRTREALAKSQGSLGSFEHLVEYRYEALADTLDYVKYIWNMTKNYVNQAFDTFKVLDEKATRNTLEGLTVVTSMGVGASLISLFTEKQPEFTSFGVLYFFILAFIGFATGKIMKKYNEKRTFKLKHIAYDKNIG